MQGTTDGQSPAAVCVRCVTRPKGEDETVEHVILECQKYDRDKMEMVRVILTEMGRKEIERTGKELMVLTVWGDECTDVQ